VAVEARVTQHIAFETLISLMALVFNRLGLDQQISHFGLKAIRSK
jgi:hypothetical protein